MHHTKLKKVLFISSILLATLSTAFARGGTLKDGTVSSEILNRDIPYSIYLPEGYDDSKSDFPVLYLLHGADEDQHTWQEKGSVQYTLDGLIAQKAIRPMIVVMPTFGPESWYTDGAHEKDAAALVDNLIPYIESHYKTEKQRSGRLIGGLSMGGYGALNISLRQPNLFCGAAILSPAIYDPLPPMDSASRRAEQFMGKDGKFNESLWKSLNYPTALESYKQKKTPVSMWIESGDNDRLGIAVMSANLYWRLHTIQPDNVELRIINGDHEWLVFRESLIHALPYIDHQCSISTAEPK